MPFDLAYTPRTSQAVPINQWFRTELKDFLRDHLTPSQIKDFGVFNPKTIEESVVAHIQGRNDHAWKLWAVLTVLVWYRQIALGSSDPGAR